MSGTFSSFEALEYIIDPRQLVSATATRIVFQNSTDFFGNDTFTVLQGTFTETGGAGTGFDSGTITAVIHSEDAAGAAPIGTYTGTFPTYEAFLADVAQIEAVYDQIQNDAPWFNLDDMGDDPIQASDTEVVFPYDGGTVVFRGTALDVANLTGTITQMERQESGGATTTSDLTPSMSLTDFITAIDPSPAVIDALIPQDHTFVSQIGADDWLEIIGGDGANTITGSDGSESIYAAGGNDTITTGGGFDWIGYDLFEPDFGHDVITDFSLEDAIWIDSPSGHLHRGDLSITKDQQNAVISGIPGANGSITLQGDFGQGDFMTGVSYGQTTITFETFLPELQEGQQLDAELVNGINNQFFLTGDGVTDFEITLKDIGHAGYANVLGVYEITQSGQIVDVRILFDNAKADKTAQTMISDVEDGHELGFFIVQNAATWAEGLGSQDTLSFIDGTGDPGSIADGDGLRLAVNGADAQQTVFHSYGAHLNVDGVQHAVSGVEAGGTAMTVGFEDLTGGGDLDYEDVVFSVTTVVPDDIPV